MMLRLALATDLIFRIALMMEDEARELTLMHGSTKTKRFGEKRFRNCFSFLSMKPKRIAKVLGK